MKSILLSALAFGAMSTVALAGPVPLTNGQMDTVVAGQNPPGLTTTTSQINGGGNTPNGTANGVPTTTTTTNNGGNAPPGHN